MIGTSDFHHLCSQALGGDEESAALIARLYPLFDMTGPGMPLPGPNFVDHANKLGDSIDPAALKKKKQAPASEHLAYLYRSALYSDQFSMPIRCKSGDVVAHFVPGHIWNDPDKRVYGPKPARVMIVSRSPGRDELEDCRVITGKIGRFVENALADCDVSPDEYANWYATFVCKFGSPTPDSPTIPAAWLKDCLPLLHQELRFVRPDYILCLGQEAAKTVLQTTGNVSSLVGRVMTIKVPDEDGEREIKVMTALNPAYMLRKPEAYDDFRNQVSRFVDLINDRSQDAEEVDHADIYTEEALVEMVDEMIADPEPNANIIAVDCEWHGEYPTEPGSYLRTIQVSNRHKWARTIVLRYDNGTEAFRPGLDVVRTQLLRLLKSTPERHVRVGGHFLRADLPWLLDFGVDVRDEYAPAPTPDDRQHGGWDTSLLYHAVNETAKYGLEECSMRFTTAPTYWQALDKWKKHYQKKKKIKAGDMGGYGVIPCSILHPYASYDADVTRRICMKFYGTDGTDGMISKDIYGNDCWLPYWTAHQASLAFLEMEQTGMVIDRDRADELTTLFMNTQDRLLADIRADLGWPSFNPKSQPQLAVALFGRRFLDRYSGTVTVPEEARPLNLLPIKTTGKRPVLWRELGPKLTATAAPSTDKESLGILGHQNETAARIRDYKFISQVLVSVLRKPNTTEDGEFAVDEEGHYEYEKGLIGAAHADNKVRTHLFQTKETGRASSSRPPLQNLSSRREDDYGRILGDAHKHPVRSILRVPEGCVGIETDLTGAELAVLAWLSQDKNFIHHVSQNLLPEDHPDHYDIHSQQAVKAFQLKGIVPTKAGMKKAGKKGLRVAAKNVNFGIPYGRGAEAIARQCKEEGVEVTPDDCQKMIDAYFNSYPKTWDFLAECRARSQNPGWIVGPYGRYRRFIPAQNDRGLQGEQERQAQNFPIQGGVADAVSIALNNFYQYRKQHPDVDYKIALQIHDAIMLIVPVEHAERVYHEVIPTCMIQGVPFWPRRLDGTLIPHAEPYHFGMDRDVFVHWGEKLKPDEAKSLGLTWL